MAITSTIAPTSRCLVTGATDPASIGFACAQLLLQAGAASVTLMGRDADKVNNAVDQLTGSTPAASGGKVFGVVGDLKIPETMDAIVEEAANKMGGKIDVLVISGGNGGSEYLGLDKNDPAGYRMNYDVAVLSSMALTKAAVRFMGETLSVVMVTSLASDIAWPDTAPFNVAKAAQHCLVKQLAFDYRESNVRVNAVLPACIHTAKLDIMAHKKGVAVDEYASLRASAHPLGRNGTATEVAHAVLYLAGSATYTTGTLLPVDGGLSLSSWWNKPRMLAEFQGNTQIKL